jgi:flagellar basal-body rod modification protein FlgD
LNPPNPPRERAMSDAKVAGAPKAVDSSAKEGGTSFKDLIQSSNAEQERVRAAQKNGDLKGARTDEEFSKAMTEKLNKDNVRRPSPNLDKDAFLKLFITQMQNQDPLNPQESTEMASQLAQFHGLEQMLNVNKNLEKMASEQATGRAVSLIDFVGKEVRLNGGKLRLEKGQLTTATYSAERDVPNAMLEVRDAAGVLVGKKDIGTLRRGENKLEFDGSTEKGRLNDGLYTFSLVGKDVQGADVPITIMSTVKVTGVDLTDQGGSFYTELGKVRVNEIATVGSAGFAAAAADAGALQPPNPAAAAALAKAVAQGGDELGPATAAAMQQIEAAAAQAPGQVAAPQPQEVQVEWAKPGESQAQPSQTQAADQQTEQQQQPPRQQAEPPQQRKAVNPYNPYAAPDTSNLSRPPEPFMPRRI